MNPTLSSISLVLILHATHYKDNLAGCTTASGLVYQPWGACAASRAYPLGTHLSIRSIASGRTVQVVVLDRNALDRSAIGRIDLSRSAYNAIALPDQRAGFRQDPGSIIVQCRVLSHDPIPSKLPSIPVTWGGGVCPNRGSLYDRAYRLRGVYEDCEATGSDRESNANASGLVQDTIRCTLSPGWSNVSPFRQSTHALLGKHSCRQLPFFIPYQITSIL